MVDAISTMDTNLSYMVPDLPRFAMSLDQYIIIGGYYKSHFARKVCVPDPTLNVLYPLSTPVYSECCVANGRRL